MFIVKYINNCLIAQSNKTMIDNRESSSKIYATVSMALATMAFIFNGFSLIILTRKNSNLRFGQIKLNLLLLSLVETFLTGFITLFHVVVEYKRSANSGGIGLLWLDLIVFYNITSLTCTRNWIVVIIACSRCEIIFVPFNSRRGLKFNHHNTKIIALIILLFSYCISFVRLFAKKALICQDTNVPQLANHLLDYRAYRLFKTYCFFIYQSVLPVMIVGIVSLAMSFSLLGSTRSSSYNSTHINDCSYFRMNHLSDQRHSSRKLNSQRKATRTILVLAVVFTLLEVPVFIIQSVVDRDDFSNHSILKIKLTELSNILIVLDSCSNIVVYLLTSDKFRLEVRRIFWQISSCQLCDENNYLSATEHLVVHQNNVLSLLSAIPLSTRSNPSHDKE